MKVSWWAWEASKQIDTERPANAVRSTERAEGEKRMSIKTMAQPIRRSSRLL
jgi:hypothetical protein